MSQLGFPGLSVIIFLPLLGAAGVLLIKEERRSSIRAWALGITLANFVLSLPLYFLFDKGEAGYQFLESSP